jgi:hypothetical protein
VRDGGRTGRGLHLLEHQPVDGMLVRGYDPLDRGRYRVWRDWLADAAAHPRCADRIRRMRQAGVLDLPDARDSW